MSPLARKTMRDAELQIIPFYRVAWQIIVKQRFRTALGGKLSVTTRRVLSIMVRAMVFCLEGYTGNGQKT
jgi:hypothetical protein